MFDANEVINGLYGFVYDENGKQMQETKAFEANVDYDKEEVLQAGKLMKGHKVIAASGAGTITAHKIDSRLQRKAADNPHAKYNFSAKLKDPTSKGEEYIMFIGVSFDLSLIHIYGAVYESLLVGCTAAFKTAVGAAIRFV